VNWNDNSSWGVPNPTVTYSEDTNNPHGGTSSQKVSVQNVPPGTAVQLVQSLTVIPGQVYTLHRLVAGRCRNEGQPDPAGRQYAVHPLRRDAGHAHRRLAAVHHQGQVNDTGSILLMFQAAQAGTFWVDDVQFTNASGAPVSGGVPWPTAKFGTLRLWDSGTSWTSLEPQQGVWNWQPLDIWVAAAEQHGVRTSCSRSARRLPGRPPIPTTSITSARALPLRPPIISTGATTSPRLPSATKGASATTRSGTSRTIPLTTPEPWPNWRNLPPRPTASSSRWTRVTPSFRRRPMCRDIWINSCKPASHRTWT
jgi:hypothetical protein